MWEEIAGLVWTILLIVVVLVLAQLAVKVGSELLFPSFWS